MSLKCIIPFFLILSCVNSVNCNMIMYFKRSDTVEILGCGVLASDRIIITTQFPLLSYGHENLVAVPALLMDEEKNNTYQLGPFIKPDATSELVVVHLVDQPVLISYKVYPAFFYPRVIKDIALDECNVVLALRKAKPDGPMSSHGVNMANGEVKMIDRFPERELYEYTHGTKPNQLPDDDPIMIDYELLPEDAELGTTCMVDNGLPMICREAVVGLMNIRFHSSQEMDEQIYRSMTACYTASNKQSHRYINLYGPRLKAALKKIDPELYDILYHEML